MKLLLNILILLVSISIRAQVRVVEDSTQKYGLQNSRGEWILRPEYDQIEDWRNEGRKYFVLMSKLNNQEMFGFADTNGNSTGPEV